MLAVNLHDFLSVLCPVKIRFHQWRGTLGLHPILCGRRTKGQLTFNGKDTSVEEHLKRHAMKMGGATCCVDALF